MAKDSFWFKHDNNARNDEKILELRANYGAEAYGIFWMIVETMAEDENGYINRGAMGGLSLGYGVPKARLKEIIDCAIELGLFHENEGKVFSNRMLRHKKDRKSYSEYGRNGAEKRWGGHREAIANPIADKKREEEKRKEIRGKGFSEDGLSVFFEDGSSQLLGLRQRQCFKEGGYEPHYIKKGLIE